MHTIKHFYFLMKQRQFFNKSDKQKKALWYLYLIILTPVCLELALLIMSAKPYIQQNYSIESSPKNAYIGHKTLGIGLNPGSYTITHNKKHAFAVNHTPNKLRKVTGRLPKDSTIVSVGFFGCSFTYGYGVNDNEHYVSKLQSLFPETYMQNHGVIGYGTVQSLLQLNALEAQNELPDKVVLGFATDHFERNALTNQFRRALKIGFDNSLETAKVTMQGAKFPYLNTPSDSIAFENWDNLYEDWTGRDLFASINFIQTKKDQITDNTRDLVTISAALIKKMNRICNHHNIEFLVVLLDSNTRTPALKIILENNKINFVEVGFDFSSTVYTNLPYDMHPNANGHQFITKKIVSAFKTLVQSD